MRSVARRHLGLVLLFAGLSLAIISAHGQAQPAASAPAQPAHQAAQQEPAKRPNNPDTAASQDLANASKQAVKAEEGEGKEHDENAKFKYSAMVAKLGRLLGIGPNGMYWVSVAANFIFLALFFWLLLRSKLPQMFRERTASIQKALKEAQVASAEASRRLGDIEARLGKLDSEVNDIRAAAERDAAVEEERIRAAAEEDKHKVVESAEAEITAIARSARSELKSFAASLAVEIASHRIKVDDDTDHALVRQFVSHLGKDGE
jgi:F-type H+-transporting ATPase subunit b